MIEDVVELGAEFQRPLLAQGNFFAGAEIDLPGPGSRLRRASALDDDAKSRPAQRQPVHWSWLYLTALLAALSHLLLDWTNNYGLRPFFPFDPRWYEGSLVFIVEPVLLLLLGSALVFPALLGLIGGEIGARRPAFRGRGSNTVTEVRRR